MTKMSKKIKTILISVGIITIFSVPVYAYSTSSPGTVGGECYCGPSGYGHGVKVTKSYSSGTTYGFGYMEIRYSGHKGTQHVTVGNTIFPSKYYFGAGDFRTDTASVYGNVVVTETHSYTPY